MLEFQPELKT